MIVYHGSNTEIASPDIRHSRARVDFGPGFYVTPLREQAVKWCLKFKRQDQNGILNKYILDDVAFIECKVLGFTAYTEAWLDFVLNCRRGMDKSDYAVVSGGIANDKVFNTVELFFDGLIDKKEAIKRLQYEKPNLQICIREQAVLDKFVKFVGSESV